MIEHIKTAVAVSLNKGLKVLSIGKYHTDRVVFFSYFGKQYSCNPKYISEYLEKNQLVSEIVWAFEKPEDFTYLTTRGIKTISYGTLGFIRTCLMSKYIITNSEIPLWLPIMKRQVYINTWHGGGAYKRVGGAYEKENAGKQKRSAIARKNPCTYVSSSEIFSEMTIRKSFEHTGKIIKSGMPRNDLLINRNREELHKAIRKMYHIPQNHKILLYAPTYRETKCASEYDMDCRALKKTLTEKFGGEWTILYRMHYFIMDQLPKSEEYVDVSMHPDMQELLYVADLLITDYSSSMWDFSLTGKPCLLYATDLDQYDLERGFYTNIHTWPFPLSESETELYRTILDFNQEEYQKAVKQYLKDSGSYEKGTATEQVVQFMEL